MLLEVVIEKALALDAYFFCAIRRVRSNLGLCFDEAHPKFQPGLYAAEASHYGTILFLPYCKLEAAFRT